jgi:cell wall-associated NlpC family hydrolase
MRKYFLYLLMAIMALFFVSSGNAQADTIHADKIYKVKRGETLYRIAKRNGITVSSLMTANHLKGELIQPGDRLQVPTASSSSAKTRKKPLKSPEVQTAFSASGDTRAKREKNPADGDAIQQGESKTRWAIHSVERGETLYRISIRFGTTARKLKEWNHLRSSRLQIGQALRVPAGEEEMPDEVADPSDLAEPAEPTPEPSLEEGMVAEGAGDMTSEDHGAASSDEDIGTYVAESMEDPGQENENSIISFARKFLGVPYRFGGESRRGIDCSAFVQRVYQYFSIDLPRTAREQFKAGVRVSKNDLQVGDLIFFQTYAKFPSHVGIYVGGGKMIHASSRYKKVTISKLDMPYYQKRFIGVIRIPASDNLSLAQKAGALAP